MFSGLRVLGFKGLGFRDNENEAGSIKGVINMRFHRNSSQNQDNSIKGPYCCPAIYGNCHLYRFWA